MQPCNDNMVLLATPQAPAPAWPVARNDHWPGRGCNDASSFLTWCKCLCQVVTELNQRIEQQQEALYLTKACGLAKTAATSGTARGILQENVTSSEEAIERLKANCALSRFRCSGDRAL